MSTKGLTPRECSVLTAIVQSLRDRDISPSFDEIATSVGGLSKSGVHRAVHNLADKGRIIIGGHGKERSIALVPEGDGLDLLAPDIREKLRGYCTAFNERPFDVIQTALEAHFEQLAAKGGVG